MSLNSEQMSFQVAPECGNALAQSKCQQDGAAYDITASEVTTEGGIEMRLLLLLLLLLI